MLVNSFKIGSFACKNPTEDDLRYIEQYTNKVNENQEVGGASKSSESASKSRKGKRRYEFIVSSHLHRLCYFNDDE